MSFVFTAFLIGQRYTHFNKLCKFLHNYFKIIFYGNKKAAYRTWCGKRQAKPDLPIFGVPSERYLSLQVIGVS